MNENLGATASEQLSRLRTRVSILGCFAPETSHKFEKRYILIVMNENLGATASEQLSRLRTRVSILGCFAPETSHKFEKR
ncbi:MAG: hypothetical protein F6J93_21090 [Oscillatoria sp. SIO1A7]|nr:hypothetical protein [Oscillatoria sp. SIO1A7]